MTRSIFAAILGVAMVSAIPLHSPEATQDTGDFGGQWTLNRDLSQFPREIGFGVDWASTGGAGQDSTARDGRGRRGSGSGGAGAFSAGRESQDDAKRLQQLTAEVRNPSSHLTIAETPTAATIKYDDGQSRTFYPDRKEHVIQLNGVPVVVTAKREAGRLVVSYSVEQDRELRYTYSRVTSPPRLVVDVQFIERGGGDQVRRIYEPSSANETLAATTAATSPATTPPGAGPQAARASVSKSVVPTVSDRLPAQTHNQVPDVELKGLANLGIVVEDLSRQAAACGLNQGTLEAAVSKRLSDAGFRVLRNSDEDTYIYVNVITTSLSTGLCVSRYDVFLYTHTTAKLSYQETPVLVQVSLLHKGGIAGGASATHAEGVLRGVQEYVDQFSTRIRDANK
jgi:hypothetical protein